MLFFFAPAVPDPAGLILTAAEVARQRALHAIRRRAAAAGAERILARVRRNRRIRR